MPESLIRKPAVSGQFYSSSAKGLKENITSLIDKEAAPKEALGCILPHAGYVYSGRVAGKTISNVIIKDNVLILGPNHTGYGAAFSIMTLGSWQTPLGEIGINSEMAKSILNRSKYLW